MSPIRIFLRSFAVGVLLFPLAILLAGFWHGNAGGGGGGSCAINGPTLTGVCDANGFTVFSPGTVANNHALVEGVTACGSATVTTTCIFYVCPASGAVVCTAGSDAADCTFAAPCATAQHAINQMRNNSPDWVLLARGNTWTNAGLDVNQTRNGLNDTSPSLVSSYDPSSNTHIPNPAISTARPQLKFDSTWYVSMGNGEAYNNRAGHHAIVGLDFYAYTRDPLNGSYTTTESQIAAAAINIDWFRAFVTTGYLMEDCRFSFFTGSSVNNQFYTYPTNIYFRRNEILTNYANASGRAQGIFFNPMGAGFYYYENIMDHSYWNQDDSITWAAPDGGNHQIYLSPHFVNGDAFTAFTAPINWSSNILSNVASSEQFRAAGTFANNLFVNETYTIGEQNQSNNTSFATSITGNVWVNSLTNQQPYQSFDVVGLGADGTFPITTNSLTFANNFAVNSPQDFSTSEGFQFEDGVNAMTAKNNVLYNFSTSGNAYQKPSTSQLLTMSVTTAGSIYIDNSMLITSAVACSTYDNGTFPATTIGGAYICATVASTTNLGISGWMMYNDGGGLKGPYSYSVRDSTTLAIAGTTFSSGFSGTLYFPYYGVAVSCTGGGSGCVNGGSATGATLDILSAGTIIRAVGLGGADYAHTVINLGGTAYTANDTLTAAAGTSCNFFVPSGACTGGFGGGTGSGLVITVNSVTSNSFGASNNSGSCLSGTGNAIDPAGTNGCSFTDPARTAGSYYSTLAGATANQTFTGHITAGVLTVDSGSPTLNIGDAITWASQTKQDYIKSGTGPYTMTGINTTVSSRAMSSWTAQQLIDLTKGDPRTPTTGQYKGNWNTNLTACAVNTYIKLGFSVTDTCNVNQ